MIAGYLARQPILDSNLNIFGYELLYRPSLDANIATGDDNLDDLEAGILALLYFLKENSADSNFFKSKNIFIKVGEKVLNNEILSLINTPENIVLELQKDAFNSNIEDKIKELKKMGYKIALENFTIGSAYTQYLKYADFFKLDYRNRQNKSVNMLTNIALSNTKAQIIAEKIEGPDLFEQAKSENISLFQGYYFLYPQNFSTETPDSDFKVLLSVLNLVSNDESPEVVAKEIKKDPVLSFKVIRYANCLQGENLSQINSIAEAVKIIKYDKLKKWIGLSLAHGKDRNNGLVLKHALIRAKLMELIANESNKSNKFKDAVFLVGLFSLSDLFMNISKGEIFEQIFLTEDIFEGIMKEKSSPFTDYLNLAIAIETTDFKEIQILMKKLNVSPQIISQCHLESISWVEKNELMGGGIKCRL